MTALTDRVRDDLSYGSELVPIRERQRHHLQQCVDHLKRSVTAGSVELRAEDLRLAARALGGITGRVDVEDILDQIFSEFCIGK